MATPLQGATARGAAPRGGAEKGSSTVEQSSHRDWSALPDLALFSIAMSLTGSHADVLAFADVCRAWRSVAGANERDLLSSFPPFLFRDRAADFYCPAQGRSYQNRRLTALLEGEGAVEAVGFSFGHLVLRHCDAEANLGAFSVVNALTGARACQFPPNSRDFPKWAMLSSPPASPDCALWSFDGYSLEFCRTGDHKWTVFSSQVGYYSSPPVVLGDKGYLSDYGELVAFDVNPLCRSSSSESVILPMGGSSSPNQQAELRLCASGAELLQIRLVRYELSSWIEGFWVYRFDFARADWERVHSLGDRLVFWDAFNATVLEEPGRWGGRGNCIYFVDMDAGALGVFHLEDNMIQFLARGPPSIPKFCLKSPVWVVPSMCSWNQ